MINLILFSGLLGGLLPVATAFYVWPYAKAFKQSTSKMNDFFFEALGVAYVYSMPLLTAFGLINIAVTIAGLAFPLHSLESIAANVQRSAPLLPLVAILQFVLILVRNPETDHSVSQKATVGTVVGIVIAVLFAAGWRGQQQIKAFAELPPAPFVYDIDTIQLTKTEFCHGEPFSFVFGGTSDGRGQSAQVDGALFVATYGINNTVQYEDDAIDTYQHTTLTRDPTEATYYDALPPFESYIIPTSIQPGLYVWQHSNQAVDERGNVISKPDTFITEPFHIIDCSGP